MYIGLDTGSALRRLTGHPTLFHGGTTPFIILWMPKYLLAMFSTGNFRCRDKMIWREHYQYFWPYIYVLSGFIYILATTDFKLSNWYFLDIMSDQIKNFLSEVCYVIDVILSQKLLCHNSFGKRVAEYRYRGRYWSSQVTIVTLTLTRRNLSADKATSNLYFIKL